MTVKVLQRAHGVLKTYVISTRQNIKKIPTILKTNNRQSIKNTPAVLNTHDRQSPKAGPRRPKNLDNLITYSLSSLLT